MTSILAKTVENADGSIVAANDAFARLIDIDRERLIGLRLEQIPCLSRFVRSPADEPGAEQLTESAPTDPPHETYALARGSAQPRYLERICEPLPGRDNAAQNLSLWHEVSAQVRSEIRCQARLERAFDLFDLIPVGLVLSGTGGQIVRVNSTMRAMVGSSIDRFMEQVPADEPGAKQSGQSESRISLTLASGQTIWVNRYIGSVPTAGIAPAVRITAAIDITREVTLEHERLAFEANKHQVHLSEVHHRIKNNLQGIAGLIQYTGASWPQMAPILDTLSEQIYAAAEVYGLQGADGGTLSVVEMVRAIARNLSRVHGTSIAVSGQFDQEVSRWTLAQREAMPIALVLSELLTNSIKHSANHASCSVTLSADAQGCMVQICNAGQLSPDFQLDGYSGLAGLGLVRAMLPERGASLAFESSSGTVTVALQLRAPTIEGMRGSGR